MCLYTFQFLILPYLYILQHFVVANVGTTGFPAIVIVPTVDPAGAFIVTFPIVLLNLALQKLLL